MYIKIYFKNKPLFLSDKIYPEMEEYSRHDDTMLIDELSSRAVQSMIHEMKLDKIHAGIMLHHHVEELKKAFFKKFTLVHAGGGVVMNEKKEILFIYRRGFWDLPKGKQDEGEDILTCAIREVEEETGVKVLDAGKEIMQTYHSYEEFGKQILKITTWFIMHTNSEEELVPQTEEDILEIKWVPKEALDVYLRQTYPTIVDVINNLLKQAN